MLSKTAWRGKPVAEAVWERVGPWLGLPLGVVDPVWEAVMEVVEEGVRVCVGDVLVVPLRVEDWLDVRTWLGLCV